MKESTIKHLAKLVLKPGYAKKIFALKKLENTPRYTRVQTDIFEHKFDLVDSASFLFMYKEVFEQQIYRFKSTRKQPLIIDAGANIGLSVLFFKKLYPDARIIAFEPDPEVFSALESNIKSFNLLDVDLVNKALWSSETDLEFMVEGADGGRIVEIQSDKRKYKVSTVKLSNYLKQPIDFLKIDIEGAETEVLKDCKDLLCNVENLFVEYHSFVDQPQSLNVLINILFDKGFRIHIHPPVTSPQPFWSRNIHLGMDMQLNLFAFRV